MTETFLIPSGLVAAQPRSTWHRAARNVYSAPLIYFAGKIGKGDWRHDIVPGLRGAISAGANDADLFNPDFVIACNGFRYGGPFFVFCDHGCAHGPTEHGAGINHPPCIEATIAFSQTIAERRREIFEINRHRVLHADHVFAYVSGSDCYGTQVEIGMANAAGVPIALGFASDLPCDVRDDLWLMERAAARTFTGTAARCFELFRREVLR